MTRCVESAKGVFDHERNKKTQDHKKGLSAAGSNIDLHPYFPYSLSHNTAEKSSAVSPPEVITVSTLEKIINVKELSTFTAVYNGIASVGDTENDEQPDYYVSYEARVKAGIVMDDVQIAVDNNNKVITVTLPKVEITEINVDISSLDFIFYNLKANTSSVTQEAYKACEDDAKEEVETQEAILTLAKQNAVNIIKALTSPIVEQLDAEYQLVIE